MHFFFRLRTVRAVGAILVISWVTACAPLQNRGPDTDVEVPSAFKAPTASDTATNTDSTPSRPDWWLIYGDPTLNKLIDQANRGNNNLQAAAARVAHARALARQSNASAVPTVSLGAGVARQQGTLVNAAGTQGTLATAGVSASYEVDVWGRLAKSAEAAKFDVRAQEALRQSALLLVQAQVAQTYLALRAVDEDATLQAQILQTRLELLRIHEQRQMLGSLSAAQLATHRQDIESVRIESVKTEQERNNLENALAVLLGEAPSVFHIPKTPWHATLPGVRPGLPADVLVRRPDIASAQQTLMGTQQRWEATRTAWLPNLTLTSAGGFASPDLKDLFNTSMQSLMLGVLTSLPIFDGGRREAQTAMAEADRAAALAHYREQVLQALREVEDRLNTSQALHEQTLLVNSTLQQALKRAEMSDSMYRNGLVSKLDNLDQHTQALQAHRQQMKIQAAQFQATVSLIQALGGGWN